MRHTTRIPRVGRKGRKILCQTAQLQKSLEVAKETVMAGLESALGSLPVDDIPDAINVFRLAIEVLVVTVRVSSVLNTPHEQR